MQKECYMKKEIKEKITASYEGRLKSTEQRHKSEKEGLEKRHKRELDALERSYKAMLTSNTEKLN